MSLVNNMLKDLDQRRKGSEQANPPVKLTPASEFRNAQSKNRWLFPTIALAVVAAGLLYLWFESSSNESERSLNIRPEIASEIPRVENLEQGQDSNTSSNPSSSAQPEATESAAGSEIASELADNSPEQMEDLVPEFQPGADENPVTVIALQSESDSILTTATESADSADEEVQNQENEARSSDPGVVTEADSVSAIVDVTDVMPEEEVKDAAELSADEQDTIAVQEALRLIADNRVVDAYAHLEQHILNNRYAHQSRETYAKLLMSQSEVGAALSLVDSGLQLAPNHPGYKKVKARILISQGAIAESVALLLTRAPDVSEDPEYHDLLATAQLLNNDYEGALISYTSLVQHDQNQGKYWYGFAASQDSLGNLGAASQAYSRAMQFGNLSASLRRRSQERLTILSQ